jgi:hypothetical protein
VGWTWWQFDGAKWSTGSFIGEEISIELKIHKRISLAGTLSRRLRNHGMHLLELERDAIGLVEWISSAMPRGLERPVGLPV